MSHSNGEFLCTNINILEILCQNLSHLNGEFDLDILCACAQDTSVTRTVIHQYSQAIPADLASFPGSPSPFLLNLPHMNIMHKKTEEEGEPDTELHPPVAAVVQKFLIDMC